MRPFRLGDIDRAQPLYEEYLTMECQRLGWVELDLPLSLRYDGHVRTRRRSCNCVMLHLPGTFNATLVCRIGPRWAVELAGAEGVS